ncbi:MAG TPA: aspartyl-phosphate phosphatase Spo0E family protein [Clostridium sp.]
MERCTTYSNTNIINKHLEEIVKLHFRGFSVKKAIEEIRYTEILKSKLNKLIVKNNFNLLTPEVIRLSQKLDKEVVREQKRKAAL